MSFFSNVAWRVLQTRPFESIRPKVCHSNAYRLEGSAKQCGSSLSAIILGSKETVAYFSKLMFIDEPKTEFLGKRTFSDVASSVELADADLTIVETNQLFSRFLLNNGFLISPRINFVLDINCSLKFIVNGFTEGKRRGIDKVVKTGFTYEITKDPTQIESFFNEIYLPHMFKRFGNSALPVSLSEFKKSSFEGDLVLLKLDKEIVAGTVLVPHENEIHAPLLAVRDVDKQLTLCTYALYYYTIVIGIQKGYAVVNFGETSPFMLDGVFKYKKDFGMRIRSAKRSDGQVFGVRFSNLNEPVKTFLKTNPFVLLDEENLSGFTFVESIADLSSAYFVPGLSSLYIVSSNFDGFTQTGFRVEKLSEENASSPSSSVLGILSKICNGTDCSIYRVVLQK